MPPSPACMPPHTAPVGAPDCLLQELYPSLIRNRLASRHGGTRLRAEPMAVLARRSKTVWAAPVLRTNEACFLAQASRASPLPRPPTSLAPYLPRLATKAVAANLSRSSPSNVPTPTKATARPARQAKPGFGRDARRCLSAPAPPARVEGPAGASPLGSERSVASLGSTRPDRRTAGLTRSSKPSDRAAPRPLRAANGRCAGNRRTSTSLLRCAASHTSR